MAVPWFQIVQLVPSIVEVSRDLLKRTKSTPAPKAGAPQSDVELAHRIVALEENERRQAELVSQMAQQMAALAKAATVLRQRVIWLSIGCGAAVVLALIALLLLVSRGS